MRQEWNQHRQWAQWAQGKEKGHGGHSSKQNLNVNPTLIERMSSHQTNSTQRIVKPTESRKHWRESEKLRSKNGRNENKNWSCQKTIWQIATAHRRIEDKTFQKAKSITKDNRTRIAEKFTTHRKGRVVDYPKPLLKKQANIRGGWKLNNLLSSIILKCKTPTGFLTDSLSDFALFL